MAAPPPSPSPLTAVQRAQLVRLERRIDEELALVSRESSSHRFSVSLPETPDAAVAAELRRLYLAAGWTRVLFGQTPGDRAPYVQLEAVVDVYLFGHTADVHIGSTR